MDFKVTLALPQVFGRNSSVRVIENTFYMRKVTNNERVSEAFWSFRNKLMCASQMAEYWKSNSS